MKPAHHMNLSDSQVQRLPCCFDDLRNGDFKRVRVAFSGAKSAELTRENADVRVIDVPIQDIGGAISVFSLPDDVGDEPERVDVCGAIEARCFALVDPFSCEDLIAD